MKTKTYEAKSSVRRAAKGMEGFDLENLQVLQNEAGKWYGTDEIEEKLDESCHLAMEYTNAADVVPTEDPTVDLTKKEVKKVTKSTTSKPCSLVWEICEQMKGAKRKEVLAACVEQGVAYYTARTQYQQWLVASRGETK